MHCHCGTNNRVPRWTFTDPCKPEVRPGAREESASPAWLAAPAMNTKRMPTVNNSTTGKYKEQNWGLLVGLLVTLRHSQCYFSYLCDDVHAAWKRRLADGRAPKAIAKLRKIMRNSVLLNNFLFSFQFYFLFMLLHKSSFLFKISLLFLPTLFLDLYTL